MTEFDFSTIPDEVNWIVEPLIPADQLVIVLAQAGVGKSLIVESLAVSVVYGVPYCGFKTIEGDVLIIDQDTPQDTLQRRLSRFGKALKTTAKYKLFVESMKGYSLSDNTIGTVINDYPTVQLIIIDSLHSICGKVNPNYTTDMSKLAKLKEKCITGFDGRTIIINHHISQKHDFEIPELMQGNTAKLAMGSSVIIQQADSFYIVGARAENGRTNKMYVRSVSKRASIPLKPIVLSIKETDTGELVDYEGFYEPELEDNEAQFDIYTLFVEKDEERTVKEVYEAMGHKHGENKVRTALSELEKQGKLRLSRHRSNLFKYRLS